MKKKERTIMKTFTTIFVVSFLFVCPNSFGASVLCPSGWIDDSSSVETKQQSAELRGGGVKS